jgi:hypothetical protein
VCGIKLDQDDTPDGVQDFLPADQLEQAMKQCCNI